mmetsp:Transcript_26924/g.51289  ORF Transcript_26924/g.51289 Transcript_26924/m.51289 type:complete len:200 (-) Transcript_26924:1856-2455(-)
MWTIHVVSGVGSASLELPCSAAAAAAVVAAVVAVVGEARSAAAAAVAVAAPLPATSAGVGSPHPAPQAGPPGSAHALAALPPPGWVLNCSSWVLMTSGPRSPSPAVVASLHALATPPLSLQCCPLLRCLAPMPSRCSSPPQPSPSPSTSSSTAPSPPLPEQALRRKSPWEMAPPLSQRLMLAGPLLFDSLSPALPTPTP